MTVLLLLQSSRCNQLPGRVQLYLRNTRRRWVTRTRVPPRALKMAEKSREKQDCRWSRLLASRAIFELRTGGCERTIAIAQPISNILQIPINHKLRAREPSISYVLPMTPTSSLFSAVLNSLSLSNAQYVTMATLHHRTTKPCSRLPIRLTRFFLVVLSHHLPTSFPASSSLSSAYFFSLPMVNLNTKLTMTAAKSAIVKIVGPRRSSNPPCPRIRMLLARQWNVKRA
jgi:hypothetical protein